MRNTLFATVACFADRLPLKDVQPIKMKTIQTWQAFSKR